MTIYELPVKYFMLLAAKISLIEEEKREINIEDFRSYVQVFLNKLSTFMNNNYIFIPIEVKLPINYHSSVDFHSIVEAAREYRTVFDFDGTTIKIKDNITINDLDRQINRAIDEEPTLNFVMMFLDNDELLNALNLTQYKEVSHRITYVVASLQRAFNNDELSYKGLRNDFTRWLSMIASSPQYVELLFRKMHLDEIEMPNMYDMPVDSTEKIVYDEIIYAIFDEKSMALPKLRKIIEDKWYTWCKDKWSERLDLNNKVFNDVVKKFFNAPVINETLKDMLGVDEIEIMLPLNPSETMSKNGLEEQRELNDVQLLFLFIFIKNAEEHLDNPRVQRAINRLLFLFDSEQVPLYRDDERENTFKNLLERDINLGVTIPIKIETSDQFFEDIYSCYIATAITLIDHIFNTPNPSDILLKLLVLETYRDITQDKEIDKAIQEHKDHPKYEEYATFICGDIDFGNPKL